MPNAVTWLVSGFDAGFTGLLLALDGGDGVTFGSGDVPRNQFIGLSGFEARGFPLPGFGGVPAAGYECSSAADEFCVPSATDDDWAPVSSDDELAPEGVQVLVAVRCVGGALDGAEAAVPFICCSKSLAMAFT